ncbi:MAG: hypothetical protein AAF493_27725 [Pseudomonadota bacterium]
MNRRVIAGTVSIVALSVAAAGFAVPLVGKEREERNRAEALAKQLTLSSAVNYAVRTRDGSAGITVASCVDAWGLREGESPDFSVLQRDVPAGSATRCEIHGRRGTIVTFAAHGVD